MTKGDLPGRVPDDERRFIKDSDLPTTPEIARAGVMHFETLARALPPGTMRNMLLWDRTVWTAFVGISPQATTSSVNSPEVNILLSQTAATTGDFITVHFIPSRDHRREYISFLNLVAGERIVRNRPDTFPDAQNDPSTWLGENATGATGSREMWGLLSGFPPWDVASFPVYLAAKDKIELSSIEYPEDFYFALDYLNGDMDSSPQDLSRMETIIKKTFPNVSQEELKTLPNATIYNIEGGHAFAGFNRKKDEEYLAALSKIYRESGIDDTAKRLENELLGRS